MLLGLNVLLLCLLAAPAASGGTVLDGRAADAGSGSVTHMAVSVPAASATAPPASHGDGMDVDADEAMADAQAAGRAARRAAAPQAPGTPSCATSVAGAGHVSRASFLAREYARVHHCTDWQQSSQ